jgi:hypothetical protein
MATDLGWYERMSQRAKSRLKIEQVRDYVEHGAAKLVEQLAADGWDQLGGYDREEYRAGPPGGCHVCYTWTRYRPFTGWHWSHDATDVPIVVVPDFQFDEDDEPGPMDFCMHACHGSGGHPLPVICYA